MRHRFGSGGPPPKRKIFRTSLAKMNQARAAGKPLFPKSPTGARATSKPLITPKTFSNPSPPSPDALRKQEEARIAQARAAEREKAARDARVREEERQALLKKIAKMPTTERKTFIEEEKLVAGARAALKKAPVVDAAWAADLFGIDLD